MRGSLVISSFHFTERHWVQKRMELPQDRAANVYGGVGGQGGLLQRWEHRHRKALIALAPEMPQPPRNQFPLGSPLRTLSHRHGMPSLLFKRMSQNRPIEPEGERMEQRPVWRRGWV